MRGTHSTKEEKPWSIPLRHFLSWVIVKYSARRASPPDFFSLLLLFLSTHLVVDPGPIRRRLIFYEKKETTNCTHMDLLNKAGAFLDRLPCRDLCVQVMNLRAHGDAHFQTGAKEQATGSKNLVRWG